MAKTKKPADKKALLNQIEEKIQALNLLKSALQSDRPRKEETLEEYRKKYLELLHKMGGHLFFSTRVRQTLHSPPALCGVMVVRVS